MFNRVSEKIPFRAGGEGRGEGQNKIVDLLKWYRVSKCALRKKRHFREGGVADMHLP